MWAASPARNSRPCCIGVDTKLRSGAMLFSIDGPVVMSGAGSEPSRSSSSSQIRASGQSSIFSSRLHWM